VLCKAALAEHRPAVRNLLHDADAEVRLRVAMALAAARDKEAVPVLVALFGELPVEQALQVEEFLSRLAGAEGPANRWDGTPATRQRCRDAWAGWWRTQGPKLDLNGSGNLEWLFGHTLVIESWDGGPQRTGRVLELDLHGQLCWQIDGLLNPVDAQVLPGGRVLIAEQGANRVTERDIKGTILWQRAFAQPMGCQRLPNGNTFLVGRGQLLEIDKAGKEVRAHSQPQQDVLAARRLADGQTVLVLNGMMAKRLDAAGKEIKTIRLSNPQYAYVQYNFANVDILPNGGFLVPQQWQNKVMELDAEGQMVGDFNVLQPLTASRLVNGNTLVVSQQPPQRIFELDRAGRVVWESKENLRPTRARRR
jgi:hypothetical protein